MLTETQTKIYIDTKSSVPIEISNHASSIEDYGKF